VDFALGETQQAVARVAADVLDRCQPSAAGPSTTDPSAADPSAADPSAADPSAADPSAADPSAADRDEPQDSAVWKELGQAGLLSLTLPAWLDGDGLGVLETAVLLTEVGRRAAAVPALATLMLGVLPVVRWGGRDLQE